MGFEALRLREIAVHWAKNISSDELKHELWYFLGKYTNFQ